MQNAFNETWTLRRTLLTRTHINVVHVPHWHCNIAENILDALLTFHEDTPLPSVALSCSSWFEPVKGDRLTYSNHMDMAATPLWVVSLSFWPLQPNQTACSQTQGQIHCLEETSLSNEQPIFTAQWPHMSKHSPTQVTLWFSSLSCRALISLTKWQNNYKRLLLLIHKNPHKDFITVLSNKMQTKKSNCACAALVEFLALIG